MKKNNRTKKRNIVLYLLAFLAIIQISACKSAEDKIIEQWVEKGEIKNKLDIIYPQNNTVFPPEFIAPTFTWKETTQNVERWFIVADTEEKEQFLTAFTVKNSWKPDADKWELLKKAALNKEIKISISGINNNTLISTSSITISISKDSVNAPIFYRDVPLPFRYALQNISKIKYRLGNISKNKESKVMLENLAVCGNCHSFTADGKTMAMDVDYANDKGSYIISDIEEETSLTIDKIITWSDYKREDKDLTFGLLSQISPDGRYVASMVKDRSIFIAKDDNIAYSQLFFPIKGIIIIYDRQTKKYFPLKGASNPKYCQANPNWSPDGKYIIFSRADAYRSKKIEQYKTAVIPAKAAKEFLEGEKEYKYDLYKIPFNNGKGGKAKAIKGASQNGKSNYFAKISPNGKWIVFTQAENFMLLQPDSKLMIVSTEGGNVRELTHNNSNMNSWHSWSPNSKWLVFSSKEQGAYTQLYLTHIDDNGNDTPPVLLENFILPNRAINIPEFVNIRSESWKKMLDVFSDSSNYPLRIGHNYLHYQNYDEAIKAFSKAIKKNPNDYSAWYSRAIAYQKAGMLEKAVKDFLKTEELNPKIMSTETNLADIYVKMKNYKAAEKIYKKVLSNNSKNAHAWSELGIIQAKHKHYMAAIESFTNVLNIQSDSAQSANNYGVWYSRALAYQRMGMLVKAIDDYKKALELNPECLNCMERLASAYMKTKNYQKAKEVFTIAINFYPDNAHFYYERGLLNIQVGQKKSGCVDLNKSVELGSKEAEAVLNKYCR